MADQPPLCLVLTGERIKLFLSDANRKGERSSDGMQ